MLLVRASAEIISMDKHALEKIEAAGRTCYKSEDRIKPGSADVFVRAILKRGHESVIEHSSATVRFIVDRGVSHEIVRHRLASYSQESTRYCDYHKGEVTFIAPPWVSIVDGKPVDYMSQAWRNAVRDAENHYKYLRACGWKPEQARSVLPNSLKTELIMTANMREWRLFFRLRTAPAAHPQMREVATPLLYAMHAAYPALFEDIVKQLSPCPGPV